MSDFETAPGQWQGPRPRQDLNDANFDASYLGTPPWDIGAPQPAVLELVDQGVLSGRVLDMGCGTGEHALLAAERGHEAAGVDVSPRAIAFAKKKASERGLAVNFVVADALELGGRLGQFDTVIDSGVFHVFDDEKRALYVESLAATTRLGGRVILVCFSDRVPGELGPRRVSRTELQASFADSWRIDSIEETHMRVTYTEEGPSAWRAVMTRVG